MFTLFCAWQGLQGARAELQGGHASRHDGLIPSIHHPCFPESSAQTRQFASWQPTAGSIRNFVQTACSRGLAAARWRQCEPRVTVSQTPTQRFVSASNAGAERYAAPCSRSSWQLQRCRWLKASWPICAYPYFQTPSATARSRTGAASRNLFQRLHPYTDAPAGMTTVRGTHPLPPCRPATTRSFACPALPLPFIAFHSLSP